MKLCKTCRVEKDESEFYWRKDSGKYREDCKVCFTGRAAERYERIKEDPEKAIKHKKRVDDYYANNKGEFKERRRKYLASKEKSPQTKIRQNVSISIGRQIKKRGGKKKGSCIRHLEFTFPELSFHLEKGFRLPENLLSDGSVWMNWNNYGRYRIDVWDNNDPSTWTWQIDHIIPHSNFDYQSMEDEAFKECWKLENLRPYSSKQNLSDSNRRPVPKKK